MSPYELKSDASCAGSAAEIRLWWLIKGIFAVGQIHLICSQTGVWTEDQIKPVLRVFHLAGFRLCCELLFHVEVPTAREVFKDRGTGLGA